MPTWPFVQFLLSEKYIAAWLSTANLTAILLI